jgi:purine-binding chemotaxis protein CheW
MADQKETLTTPTEPAADRGSDWLFTGAEIRSLQQAGDAFATGSLAPADPEPDQLEALFESDMPFDLAELEEAPHIETDVPPGVQQPQQPEEMFPARRRATGLLVAQEPAQATEEAEREKHIIFSLAGTRYAVPMNNIVEIAELNYLTPVPNVPDWIVGVTNLRGDILSVVDFRAFIGIDQEEMTDSQRMLVSQTSDGEITTGILVDQVLGMEGVEEDGVQRLTAGADNRLTPYLKGLYQRDETMLCVIDLESLLRFLESDG